MLQSHLDWGQVRSEGYLKLVVRMTLQSSGLTAMFAVATFSTLLALPLIVLKTQYAAPTHLRPNATRELLTRSSRSSVSHAFFLPQASVYALSLLWTLSIAEKSRRQSRDANQFLGQFSSPQALPDLVCSESEAACEMRPCAA